MKHALVMLALVWILVDMMGRQLGVYPDMQTCQNAANWCFQNGGGLASCRMQ